MCDDLFDACQVDKTLLFQIVDEYIYRLHDKELDELEDIIFTSNQHIYGGTEE